MKAFRVLLFILFAVAFPYTILVGINYGWNVMPIFFADIRSMNWPGQFNLDFLFHISLAALWLAWRNNFSAKGFVLAALAFLGGIHLLAGYLFVTSFQVRSIQELLVGKDRLK
jgi:hypothetical protein